MSLPRLVFVKECKDGETVYLAAGRNIQEVAPDDLYDPEVVGTYLLQEKRRIVKTVQAIKSSGR